MPSKSKSQQRLFGWAKSIKEKGKDSKEYKEAPKEVRELADSLSLDKIDDFASTKHKGLPNKVKKKKNESLTYLKRFDYFLNESDKGYPSHIDEMPSIAGIEEEDFDPIVVLEDESGKEYAIKEDILDLFLNDYPNFNIQTISPTIIVTIDEHGSTKEFKSKDLIRLEEGDWVFPTSNLFVVA